MGGALVPVTLRNLSAEGALIEGKELPAEGSSTTFSRNDLLVKSQVVWVEGRFAGVAFERHLDRDELLRQVPRPKQRFAQEFRRPGLTSRPLSAEERRMVELWAVPGALR